MLWLYGFGPADEAPGSELADSGGRRVRTFERSGVRAWICPRSSPPGRSMTEIRSHHAVVDRLWSEVTAFLPARFGQTLPDESALARALDERCGDLLAGLERVRGRAEMSLRVFEHDHPSDPEGKLPVGKKGAAGPGRAHMEALRRRAQAAVLRTGRATRLSEDIARVLGTAVEETRVDVPDPGEGSASITHLVSRDDVERYLRRVRTLQEEGPYRRLVVGGPWPPYSFSPGSGTGVEREGS